MLGPADALSHRRLGHEERARDLRRLYGYGTIASALSVPMRASEVETSQAEAITPTSFAAGTLICAFWSAVLAVVLGCRASRPARTFVRVTSTLVAVSLVFPLAASHTALSTRLVLAAGHLLTAAIIVPVVARRLRG